MIIDKSVKKDEYVVFYTSSPYYTARNVAYGLLTDPVDFVCQLFKIFSI